MSDRLKTKIYRKGWSLDCVTSERDINETYANICNGFVALFNFHIFDFGPNAPSIHCMIS